jgi:hypothetical protein
MAGKRKTKREKQVEALVETAFLKSGKNRQFNIMDLGKINKAGVNAAGTEGEVNAQAIEDAIKTACDQYEQKK